MTIYKRTYSLFALVLLTLLACSPALLAQPTAGTPVFALERQRGHLGSGAAISPDGNLVAYIGDDNGLYLYNVTLKTKTLILNQADGLDVFTNPAFSPDGTSIVFSASGGTLHYPADLFTVSTDGTNLKRLTNTEAIDNPNGGDPLFARYNDAPQFSPDGRQIAFLSRDVAANAEFTEVMSSDGSGRKTLTTGAPLGWSADGQTVLVTAGDAEIEQVPAAGGTPIRVGAHAGGHVLGTLATGDVVVRVGAAVQTMPSARSGRAAASLRLSATRTASLPALARPVPGQNDPTVLLLKSVAGTASGRTLLTYSSDDIERIEVVDIAAAR